MTNVWDKNWSQLDRGDSALRASLNNRFTSEAYACFRRFISSDDKWILEAGCGTGRFCYLLARDLPASRIRGIDASEHSIEFAKKFKTLLPTENLSFEVADIFRIPHPDNFFDVVFNEGVIEHFPAADTLNYRAALKEMIRVTKRGGKVLVAVPNWYCFAHTVYKALKGKNYPYGYEKSFSHRELLSLGLELGLEQLELTGWYPSYGYIRLADSLGFFPLLGAIIDKAQVLGDQLGGGGWFAKKFGFEILLKGIKASR